MPVPALKLDLAPPPTAWGRHHEALGWLSLAVGAAALVLVAAATWSAYREASLAGRNVVLKAEEAKDVIRKQQVIQARLRSIDVEQDLPAWRLAERILAERSLPWSRLTAELERSLVQDVRLKTLQRNRDSNRSVEVKITGEARSRSAEEAFVESLQGNACFSQVILERELELPNGGVEFELILPVAPVPPPYVPLPKYGPQRVPSAAKVNPSPGTGKPTPAGAAQSVIPPSRPVSPMTPEKRP